MTDAQSHHIPISRQARFFTLGDPQNASEIWFVLHGYGQLASFFIRNFTPFQGPEKLFVAPEGLSRFYLKDFKGRVGATWMTREDRLTEIEDYISYLNTLGRTILGNLSQPPSRIGVLGFSQGVSTAMRWVFSGAFQCQHLILWAGSLPPEIELSEHLPRFEKMRLSLAMGSRDQFATPIMWEERLTQLRELGIPFDDHLFEGEHRLDRETLGVILGAGRQLKDPLIL